VTISRRQLLRSSVAAATLPCLGHAAAASDYPNRPVRWIVGFPPGGVTDIVVRVMAQRLSERLGTAFLVENKPGAGTNIALQAGIASPADGYTLITVSSTNAINATLYKTLPFDILTDVSPVAGLYNTPLVLEVHPAVPASTVAEFIAYAKAHPGKINMASFGVGSSPHLAGELLKARTGIDFVHVPYRGEAPALTDLIAGQVQMLFSTPTASLVHVRSGAVRALGVTTATRFSLLPELPTVAETVPGYEASAFGGVAVPRGTPAAVIATLNREINLGLEDPRIKARFAEVATTLLPLTADEFGIYMAAEVAKWGEVVKLCGATAG
jgi:tripartite-type tricarboxylate transporter receptor subunit TctC